MTRPKAIVEISGAMACAHASPRRWKRPRPLIEALRGGADPEAALRAVLEGDEAARFRQLAILGADGRVAVHTGGDCIPQAGHVIGDGFACQANMMAQPTVPGAMKHAFESSGGPLAERLLGALVAAEAEGGDIRGRQSAALVVVPAAGETWERDVELRVEDHRDPVTELGRVLNLHRAYEAADVVDGGNGMIGDLFKAASNGLVRVVGDGNNHWPLVYDRDLADLYVAARRARGRVRHLSRERRGRRARQRHRRHDQAVRAGEARRAPRADRRGAAQDGRLRRRAVARSGGPQPARPRARLDAEPALGRRERRAPAGRVAGVAELG